MRLETALVGARPAHLFEAAKALMLADGFARPDAEHVRMLDVCYAPSSARRSRGRRRRRVAPPVVASGEKQMNSRALARDALTPR